MKSVPRAQETEPPVAVRPRFSLLAKGLLAFVTLFFYTFLLAAYVLNQKDAMLAEFEQLQRINRLDDAVAQLRVSAFHTIMGVNELLGSEAPGGRFRAIDFDFGLIHSSAATLATYLPEAAPDLTGVNEGFAAARESGARDDLLRLRAGLHDLLSQTYRLGDRVKARQEALALAYRQHSDQVTLNTLLLGVFGMLGYGVVIARFFTRLARHLRQLQQRATAIVRGERGAPLPMERDDEVGELMRAVNCMAHELDERERQLGLERQKVLHQEKMAAVGALAAGVAHEIGNPIAAISGMAQAMQEEQRSQGGCPCAGEVCRPDLILEQTARIAAITRQISEFASPRPQERALTDLNELVRSTCALMRFDKRFRTVTLATDLDPQLPAVSAVGDQLVQALINLLINAADALAGLTVTAPEVRVMTRLQPDGIHCSVSDNGAGMDAATQAQAVEAFFSTKARGQGAGLGLSLCQSIIEAHGGTLAIESAPGRGTRVTITLPLVAAGN